MPQLFLARLSLNVCVLYISSVRGFVSRSSCPHPCSCTNHKTHHSIDCSDRKLSTIPFLGDYVEHLEVARVDLYLSGNRFEYILKNSFYDLRGRLRTLVIWNNRYRIDVARGAFDAFLGSLEFLMIEPLADDIPTAVQMMTNLKALRELHLSTRTDDMTILSARLSGSSIRKLALVNCGFYDIAGDVFKDVNLEMLILNNNLLTTFPKEVTRAISDTVLHLSMAGNRIQELKDSDIPLRCVLVTLDLSSNNITSLEEGVLERCRGLKTLNVSNNTDLSEIGTNVFDGLSGLVIDISYTRVTRLDFVTPDQVIELHATGSGMSCSCENLINTLVPFRSKLRGTCIDNRGGKPQEMDVKYLDINCTRYTMKWRRLRRLRIADEWRDRFVSRDSGSIQNVPESPSQSLIETSFLTSATEFQPPFDDPTLETANDTSRDASTRLHSQSLDALVSQPYTIIDSVSSTILDSVSSTTLDSVSSTSLDSVSSTILESVSSTILESVSSTILESVSFTIIDSVSTESSALSSSPYKPEIIPSSTTVSASYEMTPTYDGAVPSIASMETLMSESVTYSKVKDDSHVAMPKKSSSSASARSPLNPDVIQSNSTQRRVAVGVCNVIHFDDLLQIWVNKICDRTSQSLREYCRDKHGPKTLVTFDSVKETCLKPGVTEINAETNLKEPLKETVKENLIETMYEPLRKTIKETRKGAINEQLKESVKETMKEPTREILKIQRRKEDKASKHRDTETFRKVTKVKTSVSENSRRVKTWYLKSIVSVWACCLHATVTFVAFLTLDHGLKTKQRLFPSLKNTRRKNELRLKNKIKSMNS